MSETVVILVLHVQFGSVKSHLRIYAAVYREACEMHGEICNQVGKRCGYQPLMILTIICLIDCNTLVSEYI